MSRYQWTKENGRPNAWGWALSIVYSLVMVGVFYAAKWYVGSFGHIGFVLAMTAIFAVGFFIDRRERRMKIELLPPEPQELPRSSFGQSAPDAPPGRHFSPPQGRHSWR